jgi:fibronectin type 3 domain-containing protein
MLVAVALIGLLAAGCTSDDNPLAPTASEDTTPPSIPVNVEVSGGAHRLIWDSNAEADLAGYNVYRFDPDPSRENSYVKMNGSLVTANAWLAPIDTHTWIYRVGAVDASGNESAKSGQVTVGGADAIGRIGDRDEIKRAP